MKNSQKDNEKSKTESAIKPYFSVVITTYNRANFIIRALNSLISQTEEDWEAVVVDDDSNDDTYCRIMPYLKLYSKILYLRQSHRGEAIAKNTGLWSATGRFITFLDSDDEFDKGHLKSRKAVLMTNPSVKFIYGGAKIIGNQFVPDRFDPRKKINLKDCVIGGTFFIERNTAVSLGGLKDILIGADADLFDRAKSAGITMMEVNLPTYFYHHENEDSITNMLINSLL